MSGQWIDLGGGISVFIRSYDPPHGDCPKCQTQDRWDLRWVPEMAPSAAGTTNTFPEHLTVSCGRCGWQYYMAVAS